VTTIHHGLDLSNLTGVDSGSADKTQAAPGPGAQNPAQAQPGPVSPPGEVQITSTAQLLATLEQQVAGTPEVNQGQVDALRRAVGSGTYHVDASRVADGLLAARKLDIQASANSGSGAQSPSLKAFAATAQLGSDPS
jgi:flagellar biosynthesis anti-sigma factor FlgM